MSVRPFVLALLAVAALGFAACGGGEEESDPSSSGGGPTAAEEDELREAQVKFAECMRENGIDFPDPKPGGGPQTFKVGGDSGIDPQEFEEAQKACEKYREDIRPNLSEEEKEEQKERALEFARCMREHGIDMPDPQFGENGGVQIRGERGSFDPDDPDFREAQEECGEGLFERRSAP
jgi:hypothetical protein